MSTFQETVKRLSKHHQIISGYVHENELNLTTVVPVAVLYIILLYYGISIDLVNDGEGSMTLVIPLLKKTEILNFFFKNIKYQSKIAIGLMENIKKSIISSQENITLNIKKIHKEKSFSGLLLVNSGHCLYRQSACLFKSDFIIESHHALKISIKDICENYLCNQFLYQFKEKDFDNQYMYLHSNNNNNKNSSSKPLFEESTYVDTTRNAKQYLCIQLFDAGDSICLTNMPKD